MNEEQAKVLEAALNVAVEKLNNVQTENVLLQAKVNVLSERLSQHEGSADGQGD